MKQGSGVEVKQEVKREERSVTPDRNVHLAGELEARPRVIFLKPIDKHANAQ